MVDVLQCLTKQKKNQGGNTYTYICLYIYNKPTHPYHALFSHFQYPTLFYYIYIIMSHIYQSLFWYCIQLKYTASYTYGYNMVSPILFDDFFVKQLDQLSIEHFSFYLDFFIKDMAFCVPVLVLLLYRLVCLFACVYVQKPCVFTYI